MEKNFRRRFEYEVVDQVKQQFEEMMHESVSERKIERKEIQIQGIRRDVKLLQRDTRAQQMELYIIERLTAALKY
jgi:Na+-transporting NADH:ubiquinone oxidoreductase subunit NqrC